MTYFNNVLAGQAPSTGSGGNDKGKVEALVKYSRANFLTPVPHAASFDALNATLEHVPKKLLDFFDHDMLQLIDIERFLFDHMIPCDREAL